MSPPRITNPQRIAGSVPVDLWMGRPERAVLLVNGLALARQSTDAALGTGVRQGAGRPAS